MISCSKLITTFLGSIVLIIIGFACSSQKQTESTTGDDRMPKAVYFAQSILGRQSEVIPNSDSTLFLCVKKIKPRVQYLVTNLDQEIVLQQKNINGSVKWHSATAISVEEWPGIIQDKSSKPADYIKIIEIKSKH